MVWILVILFAAAFFTVIGDNKEEKQRSQTPAPSAKKSPYSTILHVEIPSYYAPRMVGYKDGIIYMPSDTDPLAWKIGSHEEGKVFDGDQCEIGYVYTGPNNDIDIKFTLYGLRLKNPYNHATSPHGDTWFVAEILTSFSLKSITDRDSNIPLARFEGDPREAGIAFICWAREAYGNPYSDYFRL